MTSLTLASLPIEVRSLILNQLSSIGDLGALIRTCTAYHDVYATTPAKYVSRIAVKNVLDDGGNIRDPLAAIWSCTRLKSKTDTESYSGEHKATAIAFLDLYRRADETHYFDISDDELPIDEALALVKLQKTADFLAEDVLDRARETQKIPEDVTIDLSSSERRRIRRAIYRWQTYYNIFTGHKRSQGFYDVKDVHPPTLFSTEQRRNLYFAYLYPWEAEEIAVIRAYATSRYSHMLYNLDGKRYPTYSKAFNFLEVVGWTETLVAQGPDLLCQLLAQSHLNGVFLSKLVSEYRYKSLVQPRDSFMTISARLHARNSATFNGDWNTRSRLYFEGDDVSEGPNAGWVIAHQGEVEARPGAHDARMLRAFGYVFWDVARVLPGAMFDIYKFEEIIYELSGLRLPPQLSLSALQDMLAPVKLPIAERLRRLP